MKKLSDIIVDFKIIDSIGDLSTPVSKICFDSREVKEGSLYIAQRGTTVDGHDFIPQAIEAGATTIVCESFPSNIIDNIAYVKVLNAQVALGYIASQFYDNPSEKFNIIGITGTNGKTSIATLLYNLFSKLGYKVGLLSTISNFIGEREYKATHTTPDAVQLNRLFKEMLDAGCEYCFMEVSSHALAQHRTEGITFKGGVFTNLTHDHLDYHKTFAEYLKTKKSFFDNLPKTSFALVNADDKNGLVMLQNTKATKYTYASKSLVDYKVKVIERHFDTTLMEFNSTEVWTKFIGDFNAYNLAAVYGVADLLGVDKEEMLVQMSLLEPVAGRLDTYISPSGVIAIVDYAHTPDALKNVLETTKNIVEDGRVITVIGAGGNRDKTKRPEMAKIACQFSDRVILTSDNPRNEIPEKIIEDMFEGVPSEKITTTLSITSRKEAIKMAALLALKGDVILIAGKGHETYQEVGGVRNHFDDKEEIKQILN